MRPVEAVLLDMDGVLIEGEVWDAVPNDWSGAGRPPGRRHRASGARAAIGDTVRSTTEGWLRLPADPARGTLVGATAVGGTPRSGSN
jgi:hypothetical protein